MLDLEDIRRRVTFASDGPWTAETIAVTTPYAPGHHNAVTSPERPRHPIVALTGPWGGELHYQSSADRLFIAHARTDVPALVDEVEQLRELAGKLAEALDDVSRGACWTASFDSCENDGCVYRRALLDEYRTLCVPPTPEVVSDGPTQ